LRVGETDDESAKLDSGPYEQFVVAGARGGLL